MAQDDRNQMGFDSSHQMTERDIHDNQLPDDIGLKWKDLARALGYKEATIEAIEKERGTSARECCIQLLVQWICREGIDATVGKLADALKKTGLKNLADNLIIGPSRDRCYCVSQRTSVNTRSLDEANEPNQINKCERMICEMGDQFSDQLAMLASLIKEVSKMNTRIRELEDKCQEIERENSKLRVRNEELENARQQEQKGLGNNDLPEPVDSGGALTGTDEAAKGKRIGAELKNLNEQLKKDVTSLLDLPEVKQDQLKRTVKLVHFRRLSESLQMLYSKILAMVAETCTCNEDLKTEFRDFVFHGMRAIHNDLGHRVKELEFVQSEMTEEEKKDFKRLKMYQVNRQKQVEMLDKLWESLFSPPEHLHKAPRSVPIEGNDRPSESKKVSRHTDPGARPKERKQRDEITSAEAPSTSDDDNYEVHFNITKQKSVRGIFRRKESDENVTTSVSSSRQGS